MTHTKARPRMDRKPARPKDQLSRQLCKRAQTLDSNQQNWGISLEHSRQTQAPCLVKVEPRHPVHSSSRLKGVSGMHGWVCGCRDTSPAIFLASAGGYFLIKVSKGRQMATQHTNESFETREIRIVSSANTIIVPCIWVAFKDRVPVTLPSAVRLAVFGRPRRTRRASESLLRRRVNGR